MKVLVTGATGFIGGNLTRELVRRDYQVRALVRRGSNRGYVEGLGVEFVEGDLLDRESLDRALQGCRAVFHVAAFYSFWVPDPREVYRINVESTRSLLAAAMSRGVEKAVFTSSESTIGIGDGGIGTEAGEADLDELPGHYKKSKLMAEREALGFNARGLPVVVVNPTMPFGPGDVKPTPTGQVIIDFLKRKMPASFRTGMNVIDVRDVAAGHVGALEKGIPGERYILGHRNIWFKEIFEMLSKITGLRAPSIEMPAWVALTAGAFSEFFSGTLARRAPRVPLSSVKAALKVRHFDCSKAVRVLSLPQTPIETALADAVQWFRTQGYVKAS